MAWVEILGYFGAALTLTVYSMRRMIPLRIIAIAANCVFVVYGFLAEVHPQMVLHAVLLPINVYRLREMVLMIRKVKAASKGDLSIDWLKPHMRRRSAARGEVLFRKGDLSSDMFYTLTGRFRLSEIRQEIGPGQVIGEIGLMAPGNKRTLTFECIEDGELLTVSYDNVKELYFQNPEFGFRFLQLTSQRLFKDIERLQDALASSGQSQAEPRTTSIGSQG